MLELVIIVHFEGLWNRLENNEAFLLFANDCKTRKLLYLISFNFEYDFY